ncbi:MAG TPA: hypothetical protein VMI56_17035 [Reyranella sp.]|nr:hypothetical protein [Reyranella sp.]
MGLNVSIATPGGVAATYWVIERGDIDFKAGTVWFVARGYVNQAAHDAGSAYIEEISDTIPADQSNALFGQIVSYLEGAIKAADTRFAGAT